MITSDGRLIVIGGASRSGKTAYVLKDLKKNEKIPAFRRVLAWDVEDQWAQLHGWIRVTSKKALIEAIEKPGAFKIAYVAGGDIVKQFDFWAGCVQYSGRFVAPCVAIAEELSDVTTPSKARGNWGILLRRGLKRGVWIYAISQRWQEADKTALGNASEFVLFRQNGTEAEKYLSKKTGVPLGAIPTLDLHYVRFDPRNRAGMEKNRLRF